MLPTLSLTWFSSTGDKNLLDKKDATFSHNEIASNSSSQEITSAVCGPPSNL